MPLVHLPLLAALLAGAPPPAPAGPGPDASAWWVADPRAPERTWRVEVALRAVAGTGRTSYTLFDSLGFLKVSRLDFRGLDGAGGELHIRATSAGRLWATAALGLGVLGAGTLQDEDFPIPGLLDTYSSTDSAQRGGGAWQLSAALGADVHQAAAARLGAFAGARTSTETLHAFGCVQTATNQQICGGGGIPGSVRVITAETNWTAPTVGLDGALRLAPGLTASASAAWLPLIWVSGRDTHWLRTGPPAPGIDFAGPTPITASGGMGLELEAALKWRLEAGPALGIGGRLTRLTARRGLMHFEASVHPSGGEQAVAQVVSLLTERRLLWLEAAWAF